MKTPHYLVGVEIEMYGWVGTKSINIVVKIQPMEKLKFIIKFLR